ncbi:hypothetical protein [Neisseria weixii]|uniref:hypothetical protein n=1 Tax=Neisseria weixii TaxID=1853276 RepID=UPI00359FC22B
MSITAALLFTHPVHAGGIPVIDGAKLAQDAMNWALDAADRATQLANWVTQLQNWKQNLANLVRGQLMEIPAVKEALEKQAQNQINTLFAQRRQKCLTLSNTSSQLFCTRTVDLEKEKYAILMQMDKDIATAFAQIKALQQAHAKIARSNTSAGTQQKIEKNIQIVMDNLNAVLGQHQTNIAAKNALIEEYQKARVMLTKAQFSGKGFSPAVTNTVAATVLQIQAQDYLQKARQLRQTGEGISARF